MIKRALEWARQNWLFALACALTCTAAAALTVGLTARSSAIDQRIERKLIERRSTEQAVKLALIHRCYGDGGFPAMGFGDPPDVVCVGPHGLLWGRATR
jgi:hypothetical protein